jgi:hypothetical protein
MLSPNSIEPKRQGIAILICVCSGIAGAVLVVSKLASPFIVLCALSVIWEEVANWTGAPASFMAQNNERDFYKVQKWRDEIAWACACDFHWLVCAIRCSDGQSIRYVSMTRQWVAGISAPYMARLTAFGRGSKLPPYSECIPLPARFLADATQVGRFGWTVSAGYERRPDFHFGR